MEKFYFVPGIGNYYGGLNLKATESNYFWCISDYDGDDWQEIPENVFLAILPLCKEFNP